MTCNENCGFCDRRRAEEDPAYVAREAVLRRIVESVDDHTREAILTGGEPTRRRDLPILVKAASERGAQRVTLETNATLLTPRRVASLAAAGLNRARVHLPAWRDALDAITRTPGGFARTLSGMRALQHHGIELVVVAPVLAANHAQLADLPGQLRAAGLDVSAIEVFVPTSAPDPSALASMEDAVRAIEATWKTAKAADIQLRMGRDGMIPLCLFARPGRLSHLYALTPGGEDDPAYTQPPGCSECVLTASCPGLPKAALAREKDLVPRPILEDRIRRRVASVSSVDEQVARELVTTEIGRDGGVVTERRIVRVNYHCNQACHFCFVSTHLPSAAEATVRGAIEEGASQGLGIILSGGEPTLNPNLLAYVRLAKEAGASEVEVQTNATRMGDEGLARKMAEAGVDRVLISFHAASAGLSDAITDSPGTWEHTVRGIDAAVEAGIQCHLNFVFCQANRNDFPAVARMVSARWPAARIVVSFVGGMTDLVPRTERIIPRYSDVMPVLSEGMAIAEAGGVEVVGFESMCGLPLCVVPASAREIEAPPEVAAREDAEEFVYAPACDECDSRSRCFGIRRSYAALYGVEEFHALSESPPS